MDVESSSVSAANSSLLSEPHDSAALSSGGPPPVDPLSYLLQWATCVFGLIGNFFVLYIYGKKMPKAPSERFIIVIGFMDFAMNFCFILFTVTRFWMPASLFLPVCLLSNSC